MIGVLHCICSYTDITTLTMYLQPLYYFRAKKINDDADFIACSYWQLEFSDILFKKVLAIALSSSTIKLVKGVLK